jgi:23S rRNA pseudouridine1911/1915/1917 synthase
MNLSFNGMRAANYSRPTERIVPPELAGLRFDQALARMFPQHSRSRLAAWVREGKVTLDAARVEAKRKVWGGECVALAVAAEHAADAYSPESLPLAIVHEDDALIVIDKPAGLVVHPGAGNRSGTLANALLAHAPQLAAVPRAGIVHRLDKDTTGLLVVAKTPEAHTNLVRQLAARAVKREYVAVVHGTVSADGAIDAPIGRHRTARTRMAISARGKPARTRFRVVERLNGATLLAVTLETGRTHQIRVHMRSIGHPLLGDPTYGKRGEAGVTAGFRRQALHAAILALTHPSTGARCEWRALLPADMQALIASLRESRRR